MTTVDNASVEQKLNELSVRVDSLIWGYKVGGLAVLFLFSLFNIGDTLAISNFRQIFENALPGRPLPGITNFFLGYQTLVTVMAILWPILGILCLFAFKNAASTIIAISCLMIVVLLQLALNWTALFMPLISLTNSLSGT